jgi:hypothetical protein
LKKEEGKCGIRVWQVCRSDWDDLKGWTSKLQPHHLILIHNSKDHGTGFQVLDRRERKCGIMREVWQVYKWDWDVEFFT